jgi:FkbM family methyltransferase
MTHAPSVFRLIAARLPDWKPEVVFDVGANVGQSALAFAAAWRHAKIHSFEPVPDSHGRLVRATQHLEQVTAHPLALGRRSETLKMSANGRATSNHILPDQTAPDGIEVDVRAGRDMLAELALPHLSYLKIDTEGHDLDVLKGFGDTLARIDFIQVEAGMNPYNQTHVPFHKLSDLLARHGFFLFHILDQVFEFKKGGKPVLRRANPVYINGALADVGGIS